MHAGTTVGGRFALIESLPHDVPGIARFRAHDARLGRDTLVDVVSGARSEAVRAEATRASRLHDPRLARVVGVGRHEDAAYVATEHVEGVRLTDVLADRRLDSRRALAAVGGVGRALVAARTSGLHHGMLRPAAVTITPRGRVVLSGIGVDGPAQEDADAPPAAADAPTRPDDEAAAIAARARASSLAEAVDAKALAALLVRCLTGGPAADATPDDLPEDLPTQARALCEDVLAGHSPERLDAVVRALSPFDPRALAGLSEALDTLEPSVARARELEHARRAEQERAEREAREQAEIEARERAAREAWEQAAHEEAQRQSRLGAGAAAGAAAAGATTAASSLVTPETLEHARHEADEVAAEAVASPDLREQLREAEEELYETPAQREAPPEPTGPADKYEAGFDTLEVMVTEQTEARGPSTWELVLERLHRRWPRSVSITRSLDRARDRAQNGGPLNGTRLTVVVAILALIGAVWIAMAGFRAPLDDSIVIEQDPEPTTSSPAPIDPTPSPATQPSS
ncbi:hypothetical protein [Demequina pelophila]|uniref:hypothetical protein n=1 Tax=Demequina pelophila TaxID=1638984 RepID=UPI0007852529|nr:hypothetical protein [Demequina pelophila]